MRFSSPRCSRARIKSRKSRYCIATSLKQQASSQKPGADAACSLWLEAHGLLTLHGHEEFVVGLGVFELVEQEFDGGDFVHRVQQLAQNPHALQLVLGG